MAKTRLRLSPTHQLMGAIGLFALAVVLSRQAAMTSWEIEFFTVVYNTPPFIKPLVQLITQAGSVFFMGGVLTVFLLMRRYHSMIRVLMTGGLAYLVSGVAKDLWGRARPHELLGWVENLDFYVRGPGFPSGHTAMAAALAFMVGRYLPKKYHWVTPVWIVLVAWSRLYLGIHAPLDIVGGFAIGWGAYALFCHVRVYNSITGHKAKKSKKPKPNVTK